MDRSGDIRVIPLLCPECGSLLPAGADDVLYVCARCGACLELADESLARRRLYHAHGDGDVLFPFWVLPFQAATREGRVATRAAFRNLCGSLPSVNGNAEEDPPDLYIPASPFSSPQHLVRAGRLVTLRQPELTLVPRQAGRIAPIVFREEDARTMGEAILLAVVTEARKKSLPFLETFSFHPGTGMLVTIPFQEKGVKLYHAGMNLEL